MEEQDYEAIALSRLTDRHRSDEAFISILDTLVDLKETRQKEILQISENLLDIDKSEGKNLDLIGKLIGEERTLVNFIDRSYFGFLGARLSESYDIGYWYSLYKNKYGTLRTLSDEEYRRVLKARVVKNSSDNNRNSFIEVLNILSGNTNSSVSESYNNTAITVNVEDVDGLVSYYLSKYKSDRNLIPVPLGRRLNINHITSGNGGGVVPPTISCDGATNTSGCMLWTGWEEGTIDLEVDGVKVLSNASKTDLETYLFNNGDIENDLTLGCGCQDGYVRSVYVPYYRYEQGQTLFLPVSLKPNGQSITTPFTVQGTTQGQRRNFIANTLNSQLEPYGLYCVSGLSASNNIYLGVTDNRAKDNYKDTEFYILDAGNTFTSEEIPRGLPPYSCFMVS